MLFHSDLSAATGSFFAAIREGMMPAISVKTMLIRTSIMPARHGRTAVSVSMPVSDRTIRFSGMHNSIDAIHDTVHEMARDEARHGKAFAGLLNRYFGE